MSTTVSLTFDQLSVFRTVLLRARDVAGQPIDLSELSGQSAFKISYNSNVAFQLPVETTANGEVIITGDLETTDVPAGRYVYDVQLSDGNRIVSGLATVNPAVTVYFEG